MASGTKKYRYTLLRDDREVTATVVETDTKWSLEDLQKAVGGGYIEALPESMHKSVQIAYRPKGHAHIYVNEEGKYRNDFRENLHFSPVHVAGTRPWIDPIVGPAVIEEIVHA